MFCKHDWELLSETVTKSKFEHLVEVARKVGASGNFEVPWQLADGERKHIQTFTCRKCGHPVVSGYCCTTCGDPDPSSPADVK